METRRDRGTGDNRNRPSANSEFKRRADRYIWPSLVLAVAVHYLALAGLPGLNVEVREHDASVPVTEILPLLPPIQLAATAATAAPLRRPPPAPDLEPPTLDIPVVEYPEPDLSASSPEIPIEDELPPADAAPVPAPETESQTATLDDDRFIPSRVLPDLRNRAEVRRALERYYPQRLVDAGIGGTVMMMFWIDESGTIVRYQVQTSSGLRELDDAAARVVEVMRFSPLLQNGQGIPVVVALPIKFEAR